jgi:hypothetical protein
MNDTGFPFSWSWLGVTLAGAFLGFAAGEAIERWIARSRRKKRPQLSLLMGKKGLDPKKGSAHRKDRMTSSLR